MLKKQIFSIMIIAIGCISISSYAVANSEKEKQLINLLKNALTMDSQEVIEKIRKMTNKKDGIDPNFLIKEDIKLIIKYDMLNVIRNIIKVEKEEQNLRFTDSLPAIILVCLATHNPDFIELFKPSKDYYSFDASKEDADGDSAIGLAVSNGSVNIVKDLLQIMTERGQVLPNEKILESASTFGYYFNYYQNGLKSNQGENVPVHHFIEITKMLLKKQKEDIEKLGVKKNFKEILNHALENLLDTDFTPKSRFRHQIYTARYPAAMVQLLLNAGATLTLKDEEKLNSDQWKEFNPSRWEKFDISQSNQKFPYNQISWKVLVTL